MDYRTLNKWTVRDSYPLPLISNIIERLQGKTLFSKFDIRWGYNNIHIKEEDRWKAAFKTPFGLYEPTVMYFGLTNSPATFCRATQKMLQHWLNKYPDETGNYIDDMVVATKGDRQCHQQIVGELLQIFQENSYFLQPAKCEFEVSKIECLGLVVDGTTLSIDPKKADCYVRTSILTTQIRRTASFPISFLPFTEAHVQYDLATLTCTIRSDDSSLYDTILSVVGCTISISEPRILQYLVLGEFRSLST